MFLRAPLSVDRWRSRGTVLPIWGHAGPGRQEYRLDHLLVEVQASTTDVL